MKSLISCLFLVTPLFLFAQAPLAELAAKNGGGDVSKFVVVHVYKNMIGRLTLHYFGVGQRKIKDVKGTDGKRFKFQNYADIWAYMESQGYEFVKDVADNERVKERLGLHLWRKKE